MANQSADALLLLEIQGTIFELPAGEQEKVKACMAELAKTVKESGVNGLLAYAWLGAKMQVEGIV